MEIKKRILGDEHPNTFISISKLADTYSDLGQRDETAELKEKVLEVRKGMLGEEHPDTIVSMANLAVSCLLGGLTFN